MKFETIKNDLEIAIVQVANKNPTKFNDPSGYTLIDKFIHVDAHIDSNPVPFPTTSILTCMIIGNKNGEIHYFSVKKLLPNINYEL